MANSDLNFRGGRNIAMKLPPHQYEAMITFYRDTLGLAVEQTSDNSHAVE